MHFKIPLVTAVGCLATLARATSIQAVTDDYEYVGCYTDSSADRALTSSYTLDLTSNDASTCFTYCGGASGTYTYFGLEYSQPTPIRPPLISSLR